MKTKPLRQKDNNLRNSSLTCYARPLSKGLSSVAEPAIQKLKVTELSSYLSSVAESIAQNAKLQNLAATLVWLRNQLHKTASYRTHQLPQFGYGTNCTKRQVTELDNYLSSVAVPTVQNAKLQNSTTISARFQN